jgi:hypothetical protein
MVGQIVGVAVRMSACVVLGAVPGVLYAGLVGAVHVGLSGRWDRVPAFTVGCVLVGGLFGLLGGIAWALSVKSAPQPQSCSCFRGSGKGRERCSAEYLNPARNASSCSRPD